MPKPVNIMTVPELRREIERIERQKSMGRVGTPNVHVRLAQVQEELEKRLKGNAEKCERCGQEVWRDGSWKREFDDKYAELMNSGNSDWIDKANDVLTKALDQISVLVKDYEKLR
jgi:hypothetical protein